MELFSVRLRTEIFAQENLNTAYNFFGHHLARSPEHFHSDGCKPLFINPGHFIDYPIGYVKSFVAVRGNRGGCVEPISVLCHKEPESPTSPTFIFRTPQHHSSTYTSSLLAKIYHLRTRAALGLRCKIIFAQPSFPVRNHTSTTTCLPHWNPRHPKTTTTTSSSSQMPDRQCFQPSSRFSPPTIPNTQPNLITTIP